MSTGPDLSDDGWPEPVEFCDTASPVEPADVPLRTELASTRGLRGRPASAASPADAVRLVAAAGPTAVAVVGVLLLLPDGYSLLSPLVLLGCAVAAGVAALRRGPGAGWVAAAVVVTLVGVGQTFAAAPLLAAFLIIGWAVRGDGWRR